MFEVGDIVWNKVNKDGSRPFPAWAGEILEKKESTGGNLYKVLYDPSYDGKKAFLDTVAYYESKGVMKDDYDRLRKLAEDWYAGQWQFECSIEKAPAKMQVGFNK
jgi:hypothetical protein